MKKSVHLLTLDTWDSKVRCESPFKYRAEQLWLCDLTVDGLLTGKEGGGGDGRGEIKSVMCVCVFVCVCAWV
jgi:hypothetical protein